jgi:hypothetical protein
MRYSYSHSCLTLAKKLPGEDAKLLTYNPRAVEKMPSCWKLYFIFNYYSVRKHDTGGQTKIKILSC